MMLMDTNEVIWALDGLGVEYSVTEDSGLLTIEIAAQALTVVA